jgi:protein SCO1/2
VTDLVAVHRAPTEDEFAERVDALANGSRRAELVELLREDDPAYAERGAAAIVRMRGWVLLALGRVGLPDDALIFVLEELDNGRDAYLVAAAARAMRSYATPGSALAPFLVGAISNIRYRDDAVSFERYGGYAVSEPGTTAVREALVTLRALGPHARGVFRELEAMRASDSGALSPEALAELELTLAAIGSGLAEPEACCSLPVGARGFRAAATSTGSGPVESLLFEDQAGAVVRFADFFRGKPSVVVFFYTRCDNPRKCSLTVAKLARLQGLLAERGFDGRIRTAAITYDPAFDAPDRLRRYGEIRGVRTDSDHRLLRAVEGMDALRDHFGLGVNFIGSLVNRHRVEAFVLDASGRIAATFERIQWDEQRVVEEAIALLDPPSGEPPPPRGPDPARPRQRDARWQALGVVPPLAVAFFPKCPVCWATYLSATGIATLEQIPYAPWLLPVLMLAMAVNLGMLWRRGRSEGRMAGFYFAAAGAVSIAFGGLGVGGSYASMCGLALILIGSLLSVRGRRDAAERGSRRRPADVCALKQA